MSQDWKKRREADLARQSQEAARRHDAYDAAYVAERDRQEWAKYQDDYKCHLCGTPPFAYNISQVVGEDTTYEEQEDPDYFSLEKIGIGRCTICNYCVCARCSIYERNFPGSSLYLKCKKCLGY